MNIDSKSYNNFMDPIKHKIGSKFGSTGSLHVKVVQSILLFLGTLFQDSENKGLSQNRWS